jgi:predicted phage terminase large subunit-like protein
LLQLAARNSLEAYTAALGYQNAPFHKEWYRILTPENSPDHFSPLREHPLAMKEYHLEGPRKHAKSECVAINYPSWLIGRNPNIHILLVSKTGTLAGESVSHIVNRLESDPAHIEVFGNQKPKNPQAWTNSEIYVDRTERSKFPTLRACGLFGSLTGGGYDLIIADDIIDEGNVCTSSQIEKVRKWFFKVLLTTRFPWAAIFVIGTRWHYADLYAQLLEQWPHQVMKAILNEDEVNKGVQPQVLWPEVWPYERLMAQKNIIGSTFFNCQYQNDPSGLTGDLLKADWLHEYTSLPERLAFYGGIDPALGEGDFAGLATLAYDRAARKGYLVEVLAQNMPLGTFLGLVHERHSIYHYSKIYVETNSFQKALLLLPEVQGLPTAPTNTDTNKERRFIGMSSHFEAQRILVSPMLKAPNSEFFSEWVEFPHGRHDDALDAVDIVTRNALVVPPKNAFRFG